MKNYLLLLISIISTTISSGTRNSFSKKNMKSMTDNFAFSWISGAASFLIIFAMALMSGSLQKPSLYTLAMGAVFGAVIMINLYTLVYAMSIGPMSFTNLIVSCAMLIPAFSGVIFWGESINAVQIAGIVLMVVSMFLGIEFNESTNMSPKWLFVTFICFLSSGAMGILQKLHQTSVHKTQMNEFLLSAFAVCTLLLLAFCVIGKRKNGERSFSYSSGVTLKAFAAGAALGLVHMINLYLSGVMDTAVFFPAVNGGSAIAMTLTSIVIFREKQTKRQYIALFIGVAAVLLVGNIFGI